MKLNQILKNLREEWESSTDSMQGGEYREIFVNPTKQELRDLEEFSGMSTVKFIADSDKREIYVTSSDVYHYKIAEEVGLNSNYEMTKYSGKGNISGGLVEATAFCDALNFNRQLKYEPDYLERAEEIYSEIINGEYDWMEKYNFDLSVVKERSKVWLEKGIEKLK